MIRAAETHDRILAIGHQRHYSMLYAHATEVIKSGVLGDITHIRALWHRNNARPLLVNNRQQTEVVNGRTIPLYRDSWRKAIPPEDAQYFRDHPGELERAGYRDLNELVRWRLFRRTGGGLMAELGSHQLDACSIFLGKTRTSHIRPIAVTAVGGKNFYQDEREVEDNVYCIFEFPGANYDPNRPAMDHGNQNYQNIVNVTYSSISTNDFEQYGECVMGSKGTLVVEKEESVMLWGAAGRSTAVTVNTPSAGAPALDTSASTDAPAERRAADLGQSSLGPAAPSKGYREEMEHFAFCIRMRDQGMSRDREDLKPRCDGQAAMEDAIIALTANQAIRRQRRITFDPAWFDPRSQNVPDES
jgi:predicted dehydrogenase